MRSPALAFYLAVSSLATPVARPLLSRRLARGREDSARIGERLGQAGLPRPEGRLVWLHGASVGEATSALPLVSALSAHGFRVLVTTGTVTAAERMGRLLPDGVLHQFVPVDTARAVRGFLDHWRPDLAILIESELWPRLVTETARRRIPIALINARLSERSFRRWRVLPGMARALFGSFGLILTQDEVSATRIEELGGRARHAGNLKAMVEPPECDEAELQKLREMLGARKLWLAASTHEGEEEQVIAAHCGLRVGGGGAGGARSSKGGTAARGAGASGGAGSRLAEACHAGRRQSATSVSPDIPPERAASVYDGTATAPVHEVESGAKQKTTPLLILAPRHPERSETVARLLSNAGLSFARRSKGEVPDCTTDVWLADTLGEMGLWYRLAPIAFIGGSLVEVGGHTPFEPILLDTAVLHGPHVANFAPAYAALDGAGGAMEISGAPELAAVFRALLVEPALAEGLRARAREVHSGLMPDLDAMVAEILTLMEAP